jgi:DNA-directed RNA polymerase specialized sigma subunit
LAGESPLLKLTALREEIRRIDALVEDRDRLIKAAVDQGYTQHQIANAAGLSQSRVQQIITSGW